MRIAILQEDFPPAALGGAGAVVGSLAREYMRQGHEVVVVTTAQKKELAGSFVEDGVRIERLYSNYHVRWRAWRSLYNPPVTMQVKKILAHFKPDVVHAHNVHYHLSYYSLVLAKKSGAKVILTAHDVSSFEYGKLVDYKTYKINAWRQFKKERLRYNPFRNAITRFIFRYYIGRVIAVSGALKEALNANGISNVEVIHNGIDAVTWQEPAEKVIEFKKQHDIGEQAILFSGGLTSAKGSSQILAALKLITKKVPDMQLLVLGRHGEPREHVVYTGWLSGHELHAAYHAVAVAVVPSICFDSFPTINLEAMAVGKPVIATTLGGSREAIVDNVTGYIVDPFNIEMLAEKITDLLLNPEKAQAFGAAGRHRVEKEFLLEAQAKKYLELFQQAL